MIYVVLHRLCLYLSFYRSADHEIKFSDEYPNSSVLRLTESLIPKKNWEYLCLNYHYVIELKELKAQIGPVHCLTSESLNQKRNWEYLCLNYH